MGGPFQIRFRVLIPPVYYEVLVYKGMTLGLDLCSNILSFHLISLRGLAVDFPSTPVRGRVSSTSFRIVLFCFLPNGLYS